MPDAEHGETAPGAAHLVVSKLVCSLAGATDTVRLEPGSLAASIYGAEQVSEQFACSYGLNPAYQDLIFQGELRAAGFGPNGEVRLVELPALPFYVASLFLPQATSTPHDPHPLVLAFLQAASRPPV